MYKDYDFCGWATRNDLRCSDGRIIRRDAFKHNDGDKVPLIWNHDHTSPSKLIGHCILQNRPEGVFTYGYLNKSKSALEAKEGLLHGDIDSLSIYANHLQQNGLEVLHGSIKEVSLVLAGANPGARIENVIEHMDGCEEEAIITTGDILELYHSEEKAEETKKEEPKEEPKKEVDKKEDSEETVQDVIDSMTDKQRTVMYAVVGAALEAGSDGKEGPKGDVKHADDDEDEDDSEETVKDVIDSMTDKQRTVMYAVVGAALEEAGADGKESTKDEGDEEEMKHNLFEGQEMEMDNEEYLSHADMEAIFNDAENAGTLKKAALAHGITNIEYLFPAHKNVDNVPGFIKRDDGWVTAVMNGVHHTPFARIRSVFANITADEARARGFDKSNNHIKNEEVFALLKRRTSPTMIYKKQKVDRQDVIDITDFDVVSWIKSEMRMMLNEEIARAILIGDGRSTSSEDKIDEQCIRPIWTDDDVYTIKKVITVAANATEDDIAKAIIKGALKARKDYKGSGNPTLFTTEDFLTDMLLTEDTIGRRIYDDEAKLKAAMRVSNIVTVPVMENQTRTVSGTSRTLAGIIVNLNDYNVGADKGGSANLFDDFDIDYNAYKYLIETRCSGAMIRPYSAIALELVTGE